MNTQQLFDILRIFAYTWLTLFNFIFTVMWLTISSGFSAALPIAIIFAFMTGYFLRQLWKEFN